MAPAVTLSIDRFDAVIFDLDGVVTRTAAVHAAAWKETFDALLARRAGGARFEPFDVAEDYRRFVDGKPRYDGVRSFLTARGITLPEGDPADPPERETVCGVGNRKNERFRSRLAREGVATFATSLRLLEQLRAEGMPVAMVTASRNAAEVLAAARLDGIFDARVDGEEARRLGLAGKPAPDVFLEAARRLGVAPARVVVIEDARAGVAAGHAGGFGLVIGVARDGNREELRAAGAALVVADLGELAVAPAPPVPATSLPSALARLPLLAARLRGRPVVVFLDYDGTLTPIVARPEDAVLPPALRPLLRALAARVPVAVVSGRDRRMVAEFVDLPELIYVGSHGFDIAGPPGSGIRHEVAADFLPALDAVERALEERLAGIAGAQVERKRFTVAVHFRRVAPAEHARVARIVDTVLAGEPRLRKDGGKAVFELRPDLAWDKGAAVRWLLAALGRGPETVAVYLGDDLTDETAFRALGGRAIGIIVGPEARETAARFALRDTDEVVRFLAWLRDVLAEGGDGSAGAAASV